MMPFRLVWRKFSRSCRKRSTSTPHALRTGNPSSSSVNASSRCSSVAYSCRRSPASANARWRDFSRFLDNMDIVPPRLENEILSLILGLRLLFFQRALQRMLVLSRIVDGLRDLRLGDLVRVDPAYTDALLMDVQHDLGRLVTVLLKDALQDIDHEFHRRVTVVQHQHLVHRRLLGPRTGERERAGTAISLAIAVIATPRPQPRPPRGAHRRAPWSPQGPGG